ncbi:hypothetical protein ADL26_15600, partial [Thermoactinomyces vulgaris]
SPIAVDGLGHPVKVGFHGLGPFGAVEPGGEHIPFGALVLGIHVPVSTPVGAAAPGVCFGGALVAFVMGDDRSTGAGLLHAPARRVDAAVMEPAQQDQVLRARRPAIGPMLDVVRFGPSDRPVAAVPGAPFGLLEFELAAQGGVGKAQGAAQFDGFAGGVVEDRGDDPGFAGEEAGAGDADRLAFEEGQAAGVLALQRLDVHDQVEGGGVAVASSSLRGGTVPGEELVQGLSVTVRLRGQEPFGALIGLGVFLARGRAGGLEVLVEQTPGRIRERALERPHAVALRGQLQALHRLLAQLIEQLGLLSNRGPQLVQVAAQLFEGGVRAVLGHHRLGSRAL